MTLSKKLSLLLRRNSDDTIVAASEEDKECLLSPTSADANLEEGASQRLSFKPQPTKKLKIVVNILAVLLTISVLSNIATWWKWRTTNLDEFCYLHTQTFPSPIDKEIPPVYTVTHINGSVAKDNIYRMPASPEVDAAWDALGAHLLPFAIPEEDGPKYGLLPGQVKRIPEQGGGFVAILESTHHLHCLNVMRQASHWDYDYYRAEGLRVGGTVFDGPEKIIRMHFAHCMDMLRQRLMCDADPAPLGQVWVKDQGPFVFDTVPRKCRDFKLMVKWAKDNEMPPGHKNVERREGDIFYEEWP